MYSFLGQEVRIQNSLCDCVMHVVQPFLFVVSLLKLFFKIQLKVNEVTSVAAHLPPGGSSLLYRRDILRHFIFTTYNVMIILLKRSTICLTSTKKTFRFAVRISKFSFVIRQQHFIEYIPGIVKRILTFPVFQ